MATSNLTPNLETAHVQHRPAHRADRLHRRRSRATGPRTGPRPEDQPGAPRAGAVLDGGPSVSDAAALSGRRPLSPSVAGVDRLCEGLFLSTAAREKDDNLLFVRERLL